LSTTPHAVAETTQKQRDELDYIQQWIDEVCKDDKEYWTPNEEVVASYLEWCKSNNVQHPKGPKALSQSLKAKGYEVGVVRKLMARRRGELKAFVFSIIKPKSKCNFCNCTSGCFMNPLVEQFLRRLHLLTRLCWLVTVTFVTFRFGLF